MSEIEENDINTWVEEASTEGNREFRIAVHTILSAIASDENLKASMILKGGILLAINIIAIATQKIWIFLLRENSAVKLPKTVFANH